jgi:hypothetical protein
MTNPAPTSHVDPTFFTQYIVIYTSVYLLADVVDPDPESPKKTDPDLSLFCTDPDASINKQNM